MFEGVAPLETELAEVEVALGDPAVHGDPARAKALGRRYAELRPVVAAYREWLRLGDDAGAARELGADDPGYATLLVIRA